MSLFDSLVAKALKNRPDLASLRMVVEKELLHRDILQILSKNNLLKSLTFIGGTALRICYGNVRLSEDLDFTGGNDFSKDSLHAMGKILESSLKKKYGLHVVVSAPIREIGNVNTWKIKIETNLKQKNAPIQRINIDICSVSSYEKRPMILLNHYGLDIGISGLIIQTQS